eukprot:1093790-Amorphochlora_amoeboformis.AAC.1
MLDYTHGIGVRVSGAFCSQVSPTQASALCALFLLYLSGEILIKETLLTKLNIAYPKQDIHGYQAQYLSKPKPKRLKENIARGIVSVACGRQGRGSIGNVAPTKSQRLRRYVSALGNAMDNSNPGEYPNAAISVSTHVYFQSDTPKRCHINSVQIGHPQADF